MKVQVPSEEEFKERYRLSTEWCDDHPVLFEIRYRMFCDGIAYTNEQLATTQPTKRPFLSDGDIDKALNDIFIGDDRYVFDEGARWARDKYEARDGGNDQVTTAIDIDRIHELADCIMTALDSPDIDGRDTSIHNYAALIKKALNVPDVEPKWQPAVGQKCAFWSYDGVTLETGFGILDEIYPADSEKYLCSCGQWYEHVAALESLDEIGKPPSYFIERGRATV